MIVLIIGHFLTSVKFHEIPWQYQNSAKKGKFTARLRIPWFAENCGS